MRSIVAFSLGLDATIDVTSCGNAKEAIAIAMDQHPDLILCDVRMPGMDGPAMLARLRENANTANIPFVFVTANARPQEVEQLRALGSVAVITKPFEPTTLAVAIRDRLRSVQGHDA
jgi:two-component system OmpR family response regulator